MQNELKIPFESLLNRGIQRELVHPNNNNGFLNNTYTQAFTLIKVICETSKRMIDAEKDGKSCQDEIHNVIAFTGRRGTGKTSAMLSIADSLSKLSAEKGNRFEISETFIQLPYINVAVLDEEEDIFLIVLSRMFKELDVFSSGADRMYKKDFHDEIRKLKEDMCKVHGHYVNLKGKNDLTSSYYSMENLHAKYNIREEFAELVKNYTELYKKHRTDNTTQLILCIDDVDMSRQDHMRIMQCIHQYFMIPNVVVMVTLNFPILTASLQQNTFERLNTTRDKESQNLHLAFEHTHDFLRKIIPSDMRITMPSWRKYDYRNLTPVKVNLGKSSKLSVLEKKFPKLKDSVLFKKLSEHKDEDYMLSPKELVLMMLADRTTVYLDVRGNKYHFMEPDSLRNLYDIFYMLYHMNDIASIEESEGKNDAYFRGRKANRKILLDYLYFKLLPEYDFSTEEEKLINDFLAEPIDRRGKRIWDYYFKLLTSEEEKKRIEGIYGPDFYETEKERYKIENYSFGELFRILYSGSRIGLMDRKLIRFILASFSFSLPQHVENEKWRNREESKDKDKCHNLRNVFGYTLLGTWCLDMFNGYQVDTVIYNKKREITPEFIEELMLLLLMTSKSTREFFDVYDDFVVNNGEQKEFVRIENSIDPTAFIMNSLRMDERFEKMKFRYNGEFFVSDLNDKGIVTCYALSKLLSAIFNAEESGISMDSIDTLVVKQLSKCKSFYKSGKGNYKNLWYFLKYTDIAYNVIKRAVSYIVYKSENNLKDRKPVTTTPFHTIQKFYEIIREKLEEQDDKYFGNVANVSFANDFLKHPVVNKFYNSKKKKFSCGYYDSMKHDCGIEIRHLTTWRILYKMHSDNVKLLLENLSASILDKEINKKQAALIGKILISVDKYGLNIEDAKELIIGLIDGKVSVEELEDDIDDIEKKYLENLTEEESENDPS